MNSSIIFDLGTGVGSIRLALLGLKSRGDIAVRINGTCTYNDMIQISHAR